MTEFLNPWIVALAWTLASFVVWSLCAIAGQADDEAEKMGKLRRIK